MGFSYQEKGSSTRRHGAPDSVLEKGEKGDLGGKKAADSCGWAAKGLMRIGGS